MTLLPPFVRLGPDPPDLPVIISVPHAGRYYTPALLRAARLARAQLAALEDPFVDQLVGAAVAAGVTALVARAPRAEIDLNRDEREIEPATVAPALPAASLLQSARTRGGLGLIPSRIAGAGAIWRQPLSGAELARRIGDIHRPYHAALADLLAAAQRRFGIAILLDCHSMPPRPGEPDAADLVIGDRHGASSAPALVDAAAAAARDRGFRVARNIPYAGGYITCRHGAPARGIHAIQLELDRACHLDAALRAPGPGFAAAAAMIAAVAAALAAQALDPPLAIAAE